MGRMNIFHALKVSHENQRELSARLLASKPATEERAHVFEELKRESERTIHVTLRSASEIPAPQAEAIKAALKKRFVREIELEQRIDPAVIGGAVIDAGDVVIDGSVRGRLERLQSALTQ